LRRLQRAGFIEEDTGAEQTDERRAAKSWHKRARRVYRITGSGEERFAALVADAGPQTWNDEGFGVHMAFFARTPAEVRMRILEGRRRRVEERREGIRCAMARAGEHLDRYTAELHRMGLETSEREVRWLDELIAAERTQGQGPGQ
jgi:DNA-binding PadR family transcriptional regulator